MPETRQRRADSGERTADSGQCECVQATARKVTGDMSTSPFLVSTHSTEIPHSQCSLSTILVQYVLISRYLTQSHTPPGAIRPSHGRYSVRPCCKENTPSSHLSDAQRVCDPAGKPPVATPNLAFKLNHSQVAERVTPSKTPTPALFLAFVPPKLCQVLAGGSPPTAGRVDARWK
ncbi:hypothetical protein NLG97_g5580 [Lecanicillium saksenae]|uniref:Uncharacterized protein n=1 Tax=Lecanicillium saksenae TaxID=468837 RepID=A0ACC1QV96_9HYPO|nr:hypothetical protein NLG97_g5580 [Lecanicillium saksenae]